MTQLRKYILHQLISFEYSYISAHLRHKCPVYISRSIAFVCRYVHRIAFGITSPKTANKYALSCTRDFGLADILGNWTVQTGTTSLSLKVGAIKAVRRNKNTFICAEAPGPAFARVNDARAITFAYAIAANTSQTHAYINAPQKRCVYLVPNAFDRFEIAYLICSFATASSEICS